jgi:hypothetical protein
MLKQKYRIERKDDRLTKPKLETKPRDDSRRSLGIKIESKVDIKINVKIK